MKIRNLLRTAALTAATLMLWTGVSWGQAHTFTSGNLTYSNNFDAIGSAGTTYPAGWNSIRIAGTGTLNADLPLTVTDGNTTTGAMYNVGTTGNEDRCLGALASNSTIPAFGASLLNNTGGVISTLNFSFIVEQWRSGSSNTVNEVNIFEYSTNATSLSTGTWTAVSSLNLNEILTTTTTAAAVDGNNPANQASISGSITGLTLANGSTIWFRWIDDNAAGSDGILAVDNLSITATVAVDAQAPVPTFAPLNGTTNVAIDVVPTITFDEAIRNLDGSEITNANVASLITFTDYQKGIIPSTITIDGDKKVITITPTAALANEIEYTLIVSPVEDALGNEMTSTSGASFTTIAATTPLLTLTSTHTGPYYAGDDITVTWDAENIDFVNVDFYQAQLSIWINMVLEVPAGNGTATFNVFEGEQYSANYKVRVRNAADNMQVSESPAFKIRAVAQNLLTIRGYAENDEFRYNGEAVVTFSRPAGSPGWNQKFIQDETAAILIHDASTVITTPYVVGDGMSGLVGKLAIYNQLLEIIPLANPGAPVSTGNEIIPEVKTLAEITSADQSKLIKVNGVTFSEQGNFVVNTNYTLTDASKGTKPFRTSFPATEADYIGQPIPTNPMDLVMLVGQYNATIQLTSRSLEDFAVYHQLTVSAWNGNVSSTGGFYPEGEEITLTATPHIGYVFNNWTDGNMNIVSTDSEYTFNMPGADLFLSANFVGITPATISPESLIFSISQPADVEFDINWGSETEITTLNYVTWNQETQEPVFTPMILGTDYSVVDNTLTIFTTFIEQDNYHMNNGLNFNAEFGLGSESWFSIDVVFSTVPTITPTSVDYDLTNPGDVFTNIVWVDAEEITSVSVGGTPLVLDTDYRIQMGKLFIHNSYLITELLATDDTFDALITFDTDDDVTLTVTAITSGTINATIDPQFVTYTVMPDYDDFTITWNAATSLTNLNVSVFFEDGFMEFDMVEGEDYTITDINGTTANLRINYGSKSMKSYQEIMEVTVEASFDVGGPAFIYMTVIETYYEITVNVNPMEAGNVNGVWDGYREGDEVDLWANNNFGYVFINWTDADGVELSTNQNYTFTMPASDLTINANFAPIFNVTFNVVNAASEPINDAVVTLDGVTNIPGNYMFSEIIPGAYDYTVAKAGFVDVTGIATVNNVDLTIPITMIPVGVNTNALNNLSVYPNPFGNQITISNPSVVSRVVVANLLGQVVMDVRTNGVATVETAKLSAGIYLVTFEAANGESVVRKMVKK
jgi:hypothetical protein